MAKAGSALKPQIFKGINKNRLSSMGKSNFPRVKIKDDETVTLVFLTDLSGFREFDQHQWREGGSWKYVPCAGKSCPLCEDEDEDVSKTRYRFCANVYNCGDKEVQILDGPGTMAQRIALKAEKRKKNFLKLAWDITRLSTTPTSYDVDQSDDDVPKKAKDAKLLDLDAYIAEQMTRYFGEDIPKGGSKSALDDDDDDADEDEYTKSDLKNMSRKELVRVAKDMKVKTKDSDGDPLEESAIIKRILKKQAQ